MNQPSLVQDQDALVREHWGMVRGIAVTIHARIGGHIELDELIQAGLTGLFEAIRNFDPDRAASLKTFANRRIEGAIWDNIRRLDFAPRAVREFQRDHNRATNHLEQSLGRLPANDEIADHLGLSRAEYDHQQKRVHRGVFDDACHEFEDDEAVGMDRLSGGVDLEYARHEDRDCLRQMDWHRLDASERHVIEQRYFRDAGNQAIKDDLGVTISRISQLHSRAIRKLRAGPGYWRASFELGLSA